MQNAGDAVQSLSWQSLAVVKGIYGSDEFCQEITEIKFEKPVPIKVVIKSNKIEYIKVSVIIYFY